MAFTYRLELEDGTPAEPATLDTATPSWHEGDEIPLRTGQGFASSPLGRERRWRTTACWSSRPPSKSGPASASLLDGKGRAATRPGLDLAA
jgi:hypothetical protein